MTAEAVHFTADAGFPQYFRRIFRYTDLGLSGRSSSLIPLFAMARAFFHIEVPL